jgi:hypothetical protein
MLQGTCCITDGRADASQYPDTYPAIPSEHILMQCYILIINSVCLKILMFISKFPRQIYETCHWLQSCFMTTARVKFQNPNTHKEGE